MATFLFVTLFALLIALACVLTPLWWAEEPQKMLGTGTGLIIIVPLALLAMYLWVGQPTAIERPSTPADTLRAQLIEIANTLEREPDNQENWFALGMAYKNIESFSSAEHALRRALYIDEDNELIQVELAETLIFSSIENIPLEAISLLDLALASNQANQKALWLRGVIEFTNERFANAISIWKTLLDNMPPEASAREAIQNQIALAEQRQVSNGNDRVINATITIASALRGHLNGSETVFVIVQAVDGPPTPLAARRLQVSDLPTQLRLSDADAMIEGLTLSRAGDLRLTARVSLSGDVAPQPGDLQGTLILGQSPEAELTIDDVLD